MPDPVTEIKESSSSAVSPFWRVLNTLGYVYSMSILVTAIFLAAEFSRQDSPSTMFSNSTPTTSSQEPLSASDDSASVESPARVSSAQVSASRTSESHGRKRN